MAGQRVFNEGLRFFYNYLEMCIIFDWLKQSIRLSQDVNVKKVLKSVGKQDCKLAKGYKANKNLVKKF